MGRAGERLGVVRSDLPWHLLGNTGFVGIRTHLANALGNVVYANSGGAAFVEENRVSFLSQRMRSQIMKAGSPDQRLSIDQLSIRPLGSTDEDGERGRTDPRLSIN